MIVKCKLCGFISDKSIQGHINRKHNMKLNEYYDMTSSSKKDVFSEEYIEKLVSNNVGIKNPMYGKKMSEKQREKLISINKGKKVTTKTRKKMSLNHWANKKDYSKEKHPRYGTKYPVPWCKGLSLETSEKIKVAAKKSSIKHKGKKLSEEHKKKIGRGSKLAYQRPEVRKNYIKYLEKRGHKKFKYNGNSYRSSWEVDFAKRLDFMNIEFMYEHKIFDLQYKNIQKFYIPDFYLPEYDMYVEIKGYMDDESKLKIELFELLIQPIVVLSEHNDIKSWNVKNYLNANSLNTMAEIKI